jgi:hypothetical protein
MVAMRMRQKDLINLAGPDGRRALDLELSREIKTNTIMQN